MKLASVRNGQRDGRLVVVSRDLTRCTSAELIAPTLQTALDHWRVVAPKLAGLAESLEHGAVPAERFHEREALAPLPRAFQWLDGSAYVNHVELVRKARGAEMPPSFWTEPLMYQGGSDTLLGARQPIEVASEDFGIDLEGEVAVVVDDVPMGVSREDALSKIRLVLLANDISLRNLIGPELAKGFGFVHAKPSTAFSPVAVTPGELGEAWRDGKLHLPMLAMINGRPFGRPDAGKDMTFDFGALIAHAARTRRLAAGTIIGSGTVSNKDPEGGPGRSITDGGLGYTCIAEQRTIETLRTGKAVTQFLKFGDTVRLEMKDAAGHSIFGAIEQTVTRHNG